MKQLLILSGKGGTGKTTVASAFIKLAKARAYADCDVDAPNLHLISEQIARPQRSDYYGMDKSRINEDLCNQCGKCEQHCRFGAISLDSSYKVNAFACEGCSVCELVCPTNAISMYPAIAGELRLYQGDDKVFSTAQLKMGSGTSGMLVTEVKKQMKSAAGPAPLAIIDGSPGIGCPVIASLSGVDMVLIVAEPSVSGISDMERIIKTADKFEVEVVVCINKYNTNMARSQEISQYCIERKIPFAGMIPFDSEAVIAINNGMTIVDLECKSGIAVKGIYNRVMTCLYGDDGYDN